jgi:uncharacterized protein YegL
MADSGKIGQLNEGLRLFKEEVSKDELACKRVELAVVSFGDGVRVEHDFSSVEEFEPPTLDANGNTPMGEAILKAIEMVEKRKGEYKAKGVDYYRPWIFMITDGEPTDMGPSGTLWVTTKKNQNAAVSGAPKRLETHEVLWDEVVKRICDGNTEKAFRFMALSVEPTNMNTLRQILPPDRQPVKLRRFRYSDLILHFEGDGERGLDSVHPKERSCNSMVLFNTDPH